MLMSANISMLKNLGSNHITLDQKSAVNFDKFGVCVDQYVCCMNAL